MGILSIERIGGLAGYGGAGSRIKSEGKIAYLALAPVDQRKVDALFGATAKEKAAWENPLMRDGFRYRITRSGAGMSSTIEVPEDKVPISLVGCVKDRIE